jgi:hypothetical protein
MYRGKAPESGVLAALLTKVRAEGWIIRDALVWKSIVKLRPGDHRRPETRSILGAALHAEEHGCHVLVFARDRDGDPAREQQVEAGISQARGQFPSIEIVGCAAVEQIESWVLSCAGVSRAEAVTDSKAAAAQRFGDARLETLVAQLEKADIAKLPEDARSLRTWLQRAAEALSDESST